MFESDTEPINTENTENGHEEGYNYKIAPKIIIHNSEACHESALTTTLTFLTTYSLSSTALLSFYYCLP